MANNPIKFVDVKGQFIFIYHEGVYYEYRFGELYVEGKKYEGEITGFLNDIYSALNGLYFGSGYGYMAIVHLISSSNSIIFDKTDLINLFTPFNETLAAGNIPSFRAVM